MKWMRNCILTAAIAVGIPAFSVAQKADTAVLRKQSEAFLRKSFVCFADNDVKAYLKLFPDFRGFVRLVEEVGERTPVRKLRALEDSLLIEQVWISELVNLYADNYERGGKAGIHWRKLELLACSVTPVPESEEHGGAEVFNINFLVRDPVNGKIKAGRLMRSISFERSFLFGRMSSILDAPDGLDAWVALQDAPRDPILAGKTIDDYPQPAEVTEAPIELQEDYTGTAGEISVKARLHIAESTTAFAVDAANGPGFDMHLMKQTGDYCIFINLDEGIIWKLVRKGDAFSGTQETFDRKPEVPLRLQLAK